MKFMFIVLLGITMLQEKHRKQGKDEWYDKLMEDNYEECLKVAHEYMEKNK